MSDLFSQPNHISKAQYVQDLEHDAAILRANAVEIPYAARRIMDANYIDFIGLTNWSYFITVTSNHHLTERSARRTAKRIQELISSAGGAEREHNCPYYDEGKIFWVAEPHKHAGSGYHLHALIKMPYPRFTNWTKRRRFLFLLSACRRAVGGAEWLNGKGEIGLWHRMDIQDFKSDRQAEYVAKYVVKDMVDWDLFPIL